MNPPAPAAPSPGPTAEKLPNGSAFVAGPESAVAYVEKVVRVVQWADGTRHADEPERPETSAKPGLLDEVASAMNSDALRLIARANRARRVLQERNEAAPRQPGPVVVPEPNPILLSTGPLRSGHRRLWRAVRDELVAREVSFAGY
ncbi:hypothetical protein GCM10017788_68560 [Amycolatopsis acidiphila]|nr:hypothetical protein GCM10017788_68560 [Amycolatopsis acidiphila]